MTEPTREQLEETAKTLLAEALRRASTFMQHFIGMPDHAAVIVATSKMDELLGAAIRERLLPCVEKKDEFLDSERGLGTFSNRIIMAYRLGIIDASLARALHIFRRMRNVFAHAYEGQTLEVSPHAERIAELAHGIDSMPNLVSLRKTFEEVLPTLTPTRIHFVIAATDVIAKCELAITIVRRIDGVAAKTVKYP
ncbi:hypothetical protein FF011L_01590 [Roseimaritima multifibrata]|uniref:Mannitol repressor protein n=1 Tax=Roseimaritima multifibrata TaxID=1930274 RepID=A0A517M979_9BACT|nr:hypothetical protein [Roseimaritima multifibrata]QDS91429.1 hypothetical protein FF011L_01590 [Roseimaritima multifibrata]